MKHLAIALLAALIVGCSHSEKFDSIDSELKKLQTELQQFQTLKQSIEKIQSDYAAVDAQRQKQAEVEANLKGVIEDSNRLLSQIKEAEAANKTATDKVTAFAAELKTNWEQFKNAYDPKLREEVQSNADAAAKLSSSIAEVEQSSQHRLASLNKLLEQANELKELCAKSADEAKKMDAFSRLSESIGTLKGKTDAMSSRIDVFDRDLKSVQSKAQTAENTSKDLDRRVKNAEQVAQRAESKAQSAESKAMSAESKAQSASMRK